jgi:uncharacterized surface protein with fasciclin (FAS1) repeats
MGPQPVAGAASTNPLLTTLVTAVGRVPGLADTLNSQRAITVFAPYNGAFDEVKAALGEEAWGGLLANQQQLGGLLSYHVVRRRYDAEGLVAAGSVTELPGGNVTIGGTADAPTVPTARPTRRTSVRQHPDRQRDRVRDRQGAHAGRLTLGAPIPSREPSGLPPDERMRGTNV